MSEDKKRGIAIPWGVVLLLFLMPQSHASESIGYVAEHLLEVPMDSRFQAFPTAHEEIPKGKLTTTVLNVDGGKLQSSMLGIQFSQRLTTSRDRQWQLGAFFDSITFSGDTGLAEMRPQFGNIPGFPSRFPVAITGVSGHAKQYGIMLARILPLNSGKTVAVGIALQELAVSKFDVQFDTFEPNGEQSFFVSYAGKYSAITPYATISSSPVHRSSKWSTGWHSTLALPLPRQGFKGRLVGEGFDLSGDTSSQGNGAHIPDLYLGWGYHISYRPRNISIDLGGALYSAVFEPIVHKEISPPISISVTWMLP